MPKPQREELGLFIAACAKVSPAFRWTPTENLHLTIRFIGSVDRAVAEAIADGLAARPLAAFELALGAVGKFGRGRAARVVWLGLRAGADGAGALAAQVEAECSREGLAGQDRPFQAHVTLARARARDGSTLADLPALPRLDAWRSDELVLYSSQLTRSGAIYEVIRALRLK